MALYRYKLAIAYEGTLYFGWQETRSGPSIEGKLKEALEKLGSSRPILEAASRTDRGVHAEGQIVSFTLEKKWQPNVLVQAMNAHLPQDIRVLHAEEVSLNFHPTLDAKRKIYHYRVLLKKVEDPHKRHFLWHYFHPIDLTQMERCAAFLLGEKDFSTFSSRKEKNPFCHLTAIRFCFLEENVLQIHLEGSRFLYKMARALAGTLLYIGSGKLQTEDLMLMLEKKKRENAGVTAPAKGLFLHRVVY